LIGKGCIMNALRPHSVLPPLLLSFFALCASASVFAIDSKESVSVSAKEYRNDVAYIPTKTLSSTSPSDSEDKQALRKQQHSNVSKSFSSVSMVNNTDYWIYDSWVTLDADIDYDGYFSAFTVEFDADTIFANVPVYAVIYLGQDERYQSIHVTSEFSLYGDDSTDGFVVESELISGFPSGDYDILIELYDAYNDELVAFSDAYDDADLSYVSLESNNYEYVVQDTVVVVEEYGGTTGALALFGLGAFMFIRRFKL